MASECCRSWVPDREIKELASAGALLIAANHRTWTGACHIVICAPAQFCLTFNTPFRPDADLADRKIECLLRAHRDDDDTNDDGHCLPLVY